ncbi:restriction endonuclease subunit S [Bombilactobacillus bombi]|uniref:restriction endonuclease subunit S n=1 Tax=Bombilactobacillus bombi TaxID=1303590 RepID=UPI0015E5FABB|nr:restriction endonuclease subunit S [Bombilactobacillus bombi]MBA1433863.1 restriction endonuclease subunit S [Bombilactobacillus bombi]
MTEKKLVPKLRFQGFEGAWEEKKLGEVSKIVGGGTPDTSIKEYWDDGNINWYSPTELKNKSYLNNSEKKITELGLKKSAAKLHPPLSTILFTSRAGIGNMGIITTPAATNQGFQSIELNKGYNSYFVYSYGFSIKKQALRLASGSTFLEISNTDMKRIYLFFPEDVEQQKIGALFSKIDQLIDLQQQKLAKIKLLKKALLQKMFVNNGQEVPEIRFAGFEGEWEKKRLGDIADFVNGRAYKQNELLFNGKYPVLRVGNFYTNENWYYSNLELPKKNYANKGDLLYAWSASFGPHVWNGEKVIFHYHIWKIELSKFLKIDFALQILKADKTKLLSTTNGSTMAHVTKADMENKNIYICSITEQQKIGTFLKDIDNLISTNDSQLEQLKLLKKSLLQNMFV